MFPWDVDLVTRDTTEVEWLMTGMRGRELFKGRGGVDLVCR